MKDTFTLKELEQVKALSDPIRLRLLEAFSKEPMTTKQAAALLEEKQPTKLYHHVVALERAGLIKLIKTQKNRGTIEKYYQAVARKFAVDQKLFAVSKEAKEMAGSLQAIFSGALEATMAEIRQSIEAKLITAENRQRNVLLGRLRVCTTEEQIEELMKKLQGWLKECQAKGRKKGDLEYGLTVVFYPVKKVEPVKSKKK